MNFKRYLKDNLITIILIIFALITIEIFLLVYPISLFMQIYIPFVLIVSYFMGLLIDYIKRKRFYDKTISLLEGLDKKYLIAEVMPKAGFTEGNILKDVLNQTDKTMIEHVNEYKYMQEDYKEYIELWIHEIKIPIAASKMIIENNKNETTKSIDEELSKIEDYIEQVLFYARSNTVEKDYIIKRTNLRPIVNDVIKKNKNELIQNRVIINTHDINYEVATDSKWIKFILNQLIQNSIKYKSQDRALEIEIFSLEQKESTTLIIKDNGIGIKEGEISRVFEKGFTGSNGRILGKKSTGIGLYLCKKLCDKLNIAIELNSEENIGTQIKLIFPQNSYNLRKNK